jgi:glycosyltransferase involved in cell wall biosynthesis
VIVGLEVGGAELMLQRLIGVEGESRGVRHSVVSLTDIGAIGRLLQKAGIEVQALEMRSAAAIPRVLFELSRLIRREQPDIVQTWMYHADLVGGLAARIAGNRNVIWGVRTTDVEAGGTPTTTFVRHVCARLSRSVPRVIVCAAEASRRVHADVGYDNSRMVVVPNGFDLSRLEANAVQRAELRAQCGFMKDDLVVGILGRFNPAKDHENFVKAAGLLAPSHPNIRFLFVGRGLHAANKELRDWIAKTGFQDRFILLAERSDVAVCLAAMDIFCLSSRTEGFPNVVAEAMAIGLPCVVTNVGDAAMLVGETGVVVPKEDCTALAEGLAQLIAMSPSARARLGEKAKQRIKSEFTIDRTRDRFESIYRSLCEK